MHHHHTIRPGRFLILFQALLLALALLWPAPARAFEVTVRVSSVKVDFGLPHSPDNLLDNDPSTAWVGGGVGPGIGQWIELSFGVPTRVERLGIYNGHQGEGKFHQFRRIRSGRVVYPDGTETRFWLRDEPGEQMVRCSGRPHKSLRIVVDDVFPKGDRTAKVKLAVSEIKLYLSLMAPPGGERVLDVPDPSRLMAPPPIDPSMAVPEPLVALLREYYVRQTTLDPEYAELFAADVRDRNDFQFEVFREMQRQRGTFRALRSAEVDTSGLGFEMVRNDGKFAEVRVFGAYRVKVAHLDRNLEEDSVFVVVEDPEGWRIVELDGQEEF
ncbi:discoidin domain-containing protein [Pseudodesulfovibrio pelocollis]|uniref:discoidin domain-containing protein n=1 Tax=Pseudodesulfovibrio pelocollis TaxID=3051432 RepID=UPI00255A8280|nr:discoidin domain-containing protein [Pseudodesulfovibrio sp. SB368]